MNFEPTYKPHELTNMDYSKYEKIINNTKSFPSITSIISWAKSGIRYLGGSEKSPYVYKDGLYQYFTFTDGSYYLFATSIKDLQEQEK